MADEEKVMHLESTIPILLIIILAIFVAGKFGVINFSDVPVLKSVFPAPEIKVAAVGHISTGLKQYFDSEEFQQKRIVFTGEFAQSELYGGVLNNVDVIILMNEPTCDRTAREIIAKRVKDGAKLILIGDACTRVTGDESVYGWELGIDLLGNIVPVTAGSPYQREQSPARKYVATGKFKIIADPTNPIFSAIKNQEYNGALPGAAIFEVLPKADSKVLVLLNPSGTTETVVPSYRMMIESNYFLGKTMYFAYDPASQPTFGRNIFLSTILYMMGRSG